jgi:photosystem II stability/assembly factor-like uncharacterized protein
MAKKKAVHRSKKAAPKKSSSKKGAVKKSVAKKAAYKKGVKKISRKPAAAAPGAVLTDAAVDPNVVTDVLSNEETAKKVRLATEQVARIHRKRGLSNRSIVNLPRERLQKILRRLEFPNFARLREDFRNLQQRNERGFVPANAMLNALQQCDSLRTRTSVKNKMAGLPVGVHVSARSLMPTAGLTRKKGWVDLGPGNIGGRTRSIVIHPKNPATMWAGSVGGGVWRTDNGGKSWGPVDDFMANLAISCMVMDPTDPNIIYAGTGEGFSNVDALRGAGIFHTTNGKTWQHLTATSSSSFHAVNRLAISLDGKVLLAATPDGIFRSDDAQRRTWTKVLDVAIGDVDFDMSDSSKAVAGGLNNGKAYYTIDGGKTWKPATRDGRWAGRVELAYAAANANIVYASVDVNGGEIWRSVNGGVNYEKRSSLSADGQRARYLGEQGWYDNIIWAGDPTKSDLVIVGGIDLWRSTDGGNTLIDISTWWHKRSAHADHHVIVAHPEFNGTSNKTVFFGNDGGVYVTNDVYTVGNNAEQPRIKGWKELINSYGVTQFYGGAGHPDSGIIIGGAQDNGTLLYDPAAGIEKWIEIEGGDGGWCASDPTDSSCFYGEYVYLAIHRSLNSGKNVEYINGQHFDEAADEWVWKPVPYRISDSMNQNALFIAPFILDINNPNRLLAGGMLLWRTNNAKARNTSRTGPAWASIKPDIGIYISTIAVARGNSDIIWVGHAHNQGMTESGSVYRTINGTSNNPVWEKMDDQGPRSLPNRYCTRIVIDNVNHNIVYVTFGGYNRGNVWMTDDGGETWSNIGNALPEAPVRTLAIHPQNAAFLYIGTEIGVFASEDRGMTWSPTNEGPTNCSVDELFWMGEKLVCVTHGRGMFQIDLKGI